MSEQESVSADSSESQKLKISEEMEEGSSGKAISSQLHLRSSNSLDKDVVLRRIRHRKCINKVKNTFESLLGFNGSSSSSATTQQQGQELRWVDLGDAFTCP